MSNLFETAKSIGADLVAERFAGVQLVRKSGRVWSCCPLHNEKTPSCRYTTEGDRRGTFYCFGCHESGTGIDLVMKLNHVNAVDAAKMICEEFNLNYDEREPMSRETLNAIREERELRQKVDEGIKSIPMLLLNYKRKLEAEIETRGKTLDGITASTDPREINEEELMKIEDALEKHSALDLIENNVNESESPSEVLAQFRSAAGQNVMAGLKEARHD